MGTPAIDFQAVNSAALANPSYLQRRIPDSHFEGKRLHADNLNGGKGRSFNLNTETGAWSDQSTGEGGGDVTSLVAAQDGIGQVEAARRIADELGLCTPAPLARKSKDIPEAPAVGSPTKCYVYFNPDGSQAYIVGRWEKEGCRKAIRPGHFDETGAFRQGLNGIAPILYNLVGTIDRPGVIDSAFVVVVEGENKVDELARLGICATCNTGGAGKWKAEYAEYFKGKAVVILPDNDKAGKDHAAAVVASLAPVADSVKIVELPGLPDKGDIIDWLNVPGNDKERIAALMNDAPYWKMEGAESEPFKYNVLSCTDILALPRPQWRLKGVLPEMVMAAFFGPSRAGKSFVALDLAFAVTRGADWFGWKTTLCPVLYVNLESSWGLRSRLMAWMQDTGHSLPDNLSFILDGFDLLNPEHVKAITHAAPQSGIVILDTLNRAAPGADENSSRDMGLIIKAATEIQQAISGLVLLVTHSGKDTAKGVRGHSSLFAALDACIEVDRKGDSRVLKLDKVKEGVDGITQEFQLKSVVIGHAPDGSAVTSCVVKPVSGREKEKNITPALKYALDSFNKARGGNESVDLESWRKVFYAGHTGENIDAKKKAFQRARDGLVKSEIISVNNDTYTGTGRDNIGTSPDCPAGLFTGTGRDNTL